MTSHNDDERTNTEKMLRLPVEVEIGGRKFELQPKGLRASGKWLGKVLKLTRDQGLDIFQLSSNSPNESIEAMLLMMDSVFDFADWPTEDQEWIDRNGSFPEVVNAFVQIVGMVAPSPPENPQQPIGETNPIGETKNGQHGDGLPSISSLEQV